MHPLGVYLTVIRVAILPATRARDVRILKLATVSELATCIVLFWGGSTWFKYLPGERLGLLRSPCWTNTAREQAYPRQASGIGDLPIGILGSPKSM